MYIKPSYVVSHTKLQDSHLCNPFDAMRPNSRCQLPRQSRRPPLHLSSSTTPPLLHQPPLPQKQPLLPQSLQLSLDLIPLRRNPMRLIRLGPEAMHREPLVQVRAEVVHYADGEEDVHPELEDFEVGSAHVCGLVVRLVGLV